MNMEQNITDCHTHKTLFLQIKKCAVIKDT